MIKIVTGPIQSGKTTRLIAWVRYHQNSAGILSPVVNRQRFIYSIHSNEYRKLQFDKQGITQEKSIKIGKNEFQLSTFNWAQEQLRSALKINPHWLIIDEIGPLELDGHGLEPMVTHVLNNFVMSEKHQLVLVVREKLVNDVIINYNLKENYNIVHTFPDIMLS
jgi:nucleoside-triphosphatase THEP1